MKRSKPLVWLHGEIKTPPFSRVGRIEAGFLLRRLQNGELIDMPASRPLPAIGPNCHELRVIDGHINWRIVCHVDSDAVVILEIFQKKTRTLPKRVIDVTRKRLRAYHRATEEKK
jgi:phage-related protein